MSELIKTFNLGDVVTSGLCPLRVGGEENEEEKPHSPLYLRHTLETISCRRLLHGFASNPPSATPRSVFREFTPNPTPARFRTLSLQSNSANLSSSFDASPCRGERRPVVLLSEIQQADWLCWPGCDVRRWNKKTRLTNRSGHLRCSTGVGIE